MRSVSMDKEKGRPIIAHGATLPLFLTPAMARTGYWEKKARLLTRLLCWPCRGC